MENNTASDQIVERESKSMLTPEEYRLLMDHFKKTGDDSVPQSNYFYDTEDLALDRNDVTLRVRARKGEYELTVKQKPKPQKLTFMQFLGLSKKPEKEGRLETNHRPFTPEQREVFFKQGLVPDGNVKNMLASLNLLAPYHFHGDLTTMRTEFMYHGCKLALDFSKYLDVEDYEIEMEQSDLEVDQSQALMNLLATMSIPYRKAIGKRKRFYKRKKALMSERTH